jgi:predicted alpha-1,6-mannanase (GH76 family)
MSWSRYVGYADAAYQALMDGWYDSDSGRWDPPGFFNGYGGFGWWQCANALTTVINYSSLRPVGNIQNMIATAFQQNNSTNFRYDPSKPSGSQSVYDDEAWWALAWIAAYDATARREYLGMAETIFNDMSSQWTWECGGGLFWDTAHKYKNAIVNELFLTLAIRLFRRTSDARYRAWALDEWNWFQRSGMQDPNTGLINDGLDSTTCTNNHGNAWSYNQGVILGGLADLFLTTQDPAHLAAAWTIAQAVIQPSANSLVDANHVLMEPGYSGAPSYDDDAIQFKGIFARNLSYLASVDPESAHWPVYSTFLAANANSLWLNSRNENNYFGYNWAGPFDSSDPSRQSSAMDALVAAIRLDAL